MVRYPGGCKDSGCGWNGIDGLFYILVYMLFSLAMGRELLILELHSLGLKLNWLLAPQVTMSHSRGLLPEGPRTPRLSSLDVFCSVL